MTSTIRNLPSIVEQGTEGIWAYRKWSDGTAECWGNRTGTTNISTAWGGMYISTSFTQNFPSGLFTSTPTLQAHSIGTSGSSIPVGASILNATGFTMQLARGSSATNVSYNLCLFAIGKWN